MTGFSSTATASGALVIPGSVAYLGDEYTVTASGALVIPGSVAYLGDEYTVTAIGANAFKDQSGFTSLSIPDSVTAIGNYAFSGCEGITGAITLPANLTTIGDHAFANMTGIAGALDIPAGVTAIGDNAFYVGGNSRDYGWEGITALSFADGSQLAVIGDYAFAGNWNLRGDITIPEGVTSIGEYAFNATCASNDNLQGALTLPSNIASIGAHALHHRFHAHA